MTCRWTAFVLGAAAALSSACESDVIDDAGFQLWCGEQLCVWDLDEGEIERVSTWHEYDYAVSFVASPTVLSQPAQRVESSLCIETTSRIDRDAVVGVLLDADGDGVTDWSVTLPPSRTFVYSRWDAPPLGFDGVLHVRKVGDGEAIIARLRASQECTTDHRWRRGD